MHEHENEIKEHERRVKKNPCGMSNKTCCVVMIACPLIIITLLIFVLAFTMTTYYVETECGELYEWGPYFDDAKEKITDWGASDLMLEAYDRAKAAGQLNFICPNTYDNPPEREFILWTQLGRAEGGAWYKGEAYRDNENRIVPDGKGLWLAQGRTETKDFPGMDPFDFVTPNQLVIGNFKDGQLTGVYQSIDNDGYIIEYPIPNDYIPQRGEEYLPWEAFDIWMVYPPQRDIYAWHSRSRNIRYDKISTNQYERYCPCNCVEKENCPEEED